VSRNARGAAAGGVVVVDKPAGISSAGVVAAVKRIFGARKAGHAGTLDPFATGVLVCCLNQATRLSRFFLHGDKAYAAQLHLGIETDTQDATGKVIGVAEDPKLSQAEIQAAFERFKGRIWQTPPTYSALKHRGTPLYKLARSGAPVQKEARQVVISHLDVRAIHLPEVWFDVVCSGGTYVRTLCADIGRTLGCGGHLKALRRVESSGFKITEAVSLETLEALAGTDRLDTAVIAMADALRNTPAFRADVCLAEKIRFGRKLSAADVTGPCGEAPPKKGQRLVKILDGEGCLLAVLEYNRHSGSYDYCVNLQ